MESLKEPDVHTFVVFGAYGIFPADVKGGRGLVSGLSKASKLSSHTDGVAWPHTPHPWL